MKIGILNLQGGIVEHIYLLRKAFHNKGINGEVIMIEDKEGLKKIDGLIIPGGESTTMGVLLAKSNMVDALREFILKGHPTMGVCAGAILMAKEVIDYNKGETRQTILETMNIKAIRNFFGRQKDSFETLIKIRVLDGPPYRCIFIRAPVFEKLSHKVDELANLHGKIVMARENNMLVTSFHPELTDDPRIHELFIEFF